MNGVKLKKYNIIKAASWYTIGNLLIKGISFFVIPIFTRLMNTHDYGVYSVYTSYLAIFETFILVGMSATVAIARYAKEVDFDSYISTAISVPVILAGLFAVGINTYIVVFHDFLSMNYVLWDCLLITAACGAVNNTVGAKLVIEGRYRLYMGYSALYTLGNIGLSLILCFCIYREQDAHLARIFGSTLATVFCLVYLLAFSRTWFSIKWKNLQYALKWGVPLLFHTLATVVLVQSDRIIIRYMDSYSAAGIYAIATTVVTIPMILLQSFSQAWQPWFYDKLDRRDYSSIRWLNDRYIIGFASIITLFMLVAPEIIHFFTEESYWDSVYSLIPLAISVFGEMIYGIPASVEYYYKKSLYIMIGTIITVVINLGLDFLFIYKFGLVGAAYATAISKLLLFVMHCVFMRRVENNAVFSKRVVVVSLIVLVTINMMSVLFMDAIGIRYMIVVTIVMASGYYVYRLNNSFLTNIRRR